MLLLIEDNPFFDKKMFFQKKMMNDETITLWGNLKMSSLISDPPQMPGFQFDNVKR